MIFIKPHNQEVEKFAYDELWAQMFAEANTYNIIFFAELTTADAAFTENVDELLHQTKDHHFELDDHACWHAEHGKIHDADCWKATVNAILYFEAAD